MNNPVDQPKVSELDAKALEQDIITGVAQFHALFAGNDWQTLMDRAANVRATANARFAEDIAQAEALEDRAHEIAKQAGVLGHLS